MISKKITTLTMLPAIPLMIFSCTSAQEKTDQKQESINVSLPDSNPYILSELTTEQQTAFDAFDSIQVRGQHLYSTFPGIYHDCLPADTSFVISRAELMIAMKELLSRYYQNIPLEEQTKLSDQAVLAQEEYLVLQCNGYAAGSIYIVPEKTTASGFWVLPEVLGRRDIVIEW